MPMPSALGARYLGSVLPSPQLMGLESVMAVGAGALPVSVFGTKGTRGRCMNEETVSVGGTRKWQEVHFRLSGSGEER